MALDDRSVTFPDLPTETVASLYVVISLVLARSVPDETLRGMVARAEAAAVRQGIELP